MHYTLPRIRSASAYRSHEPRREMKSNRRSRSATSISSMVIGCLLLLLTVVVQPVLSTAVAAPPKNSNPVASLVGYVKDSAVRTVNGVVQLKTHHSRCNEIRAKIKGYRQQLQEKWENEGTYAGATKKEIQKRLLGHMGGISYEEFCFLKRGKEDRGKLFNLVFISFGAPRFLPYALMFNPTMLPSTFQAPDTSHALDDPRGWSHAMIHGLMDMEAKAATEPSLGIWSTLLRQRQSKLAQHALLQDMTQMTARALQNATPVTELLAQLPPPPATRREQRLAHWPAIVTKSIARTLSGSGATPGLLAQITPNFMARSKLMTQLDQIAAADDFLRETGAIPSQRALLEAACRDRFVLCKYYANSMDDDEQQQQQPIPIPVLQDQLREWLTITAQHPTHLGRLVVILHNGCTAIREQGAQYGDGTNSLAHLLCQQQQRNSAVKNESSEQKVMAEKKGRRRKRT